MSPEDLQFQTEIKREFEFIHDNKKYLITYGKEDGKDYIQLAREFETGERFHSFKEMMAKAKVGNQFLREYIRSL
ncbi:MAG: hypothetical protein K6A42_04550 [Treponema sp.]|nr:hypothetical protein [Treponema sp.]